MLAQIKNNALGAGLQNLTGVEFFGKLLPTMVGIVLVIGFIIFLFMMLVGGVKWISSGGDKAQLESARGTVLHGVIGVIILISVFAIVKLIEGIFGVKILTIDISPLIIQ